VENVIKAISKLLQGTKLTASGVDNHIYICVSSEHFVFKTHSTSGLMHSKCFEGVR